GIIQQLCEAAPASDLWHPNDQTATIGALAEAAGRGDPIAARVLRETAHYLGAGVANIINLFNPQVIVIAGWVGLLLGPYLLPELRHFVERYALKQPLGAARIQLCELRYNPV